MVAPRTFRLETPRKKREIGRAVTVQLYDGAFGHVIYEITRPGIEIVEVRKGDTKENDLVGGVKAAEALGGSAQLCVGDPNREDAQWTDVVKHSRFSKVNDFTLSMPDPTGKIANLHWKHTKDVGGIFRKFDNCNLKLVDEESNLIVARFIHKAGSLWVMEGVFEMYEDMGEEWDIKVFLSCLAVLKYQGLIFNLNLL